MYPSQRRPWTDHWTVRAVLAASALCADQRLPVRSAAWYARSLPALSDAIALVRQPLWAWPDILGMSSAGPDIPEVFRAVCPDLGREPWSCLRIAETHREGRGTAPRVHCALGRADDPVSGGSTDAKLRSLSRQAKHVRLVDAYRSGGREAEAGREPVPDLAFFETTSLSFEAGVDSAWPVGPLRGLC